MTTDEADRLLLSQQGVATRAQLAAAGLTRRALERALSDGRLRRERTGLYVCSDRPARGLHLLSGGRCDPGYLAEVRAAVLTMGGDAAASRRTAAVLWGFDMFVEPSLVELVELDVHPSRSRAERRGLDVRRRAPRDVEERSVLGTSPVRVTGPLRTVLDVAGTRPLTEAVVVADSALRTGRVALEDLQAAAALRARAASAEQVRRVVRWVDARSGSVLESLLRVLLAQHGILVPRTQLVVLDGDGAFVGRVDFAWPVERLIVETDGRRWHDPADARDRDRLRTNAYARLGWSVLRFTWADVVHEPETVVAAVRACLGLSGEGAA
jgi:very-short-patch-repair endonuclease